MADGTEEKWSPRRTAVLIGHGAAEATLLQAWAGGRPHHAWLISGPRGIGKATLAYRFARFLLSNPKPAGADVPETLAVTADSALFNRIAAGGHSDLLTVERGVDAKGKVRSGIAVEDVRRITEFLHRTAFEGGWRVVIVDCADDLNRNGANALLKILEEPPRNAMLLLVCHSPGTLPPTVRSRCRRLTLQPLDAEATCAVIGTHRPDIGVDDAATLARISEGRPGYALALAEQGGLQLFRDLIALCGTLPDLDIPKAHAMAERFAGPNGAGAFEVFQALFRWWLARLVRVGGAEAPAHPGEPLDLVAGEAALVARLGSAANLDRWLELWEKTGRLFDRGDALNLDRRQVVLNALLALRTAVRPPRAVAVR